jgi:Calcineurin-like phosphoesterase
MPGRASKTHLQTHRHESTSQTHRGAGFGRASGDYVRREGSLRVNLSRRAFKTIPGSWWILGAASRGISTSPKPAKETAKLAESRKQIADKVVTEGADAKQGDVFTADIAAYLKREIAATFAGSEGARIRASLRGAEPAHGVALKVNGAYPQGVPLQPTPPTVLESNYMDPAQLDWLEQSLHNSKAKWKICYFHHPLYSDGKYHGPDLDLRAQVLPIFKRNGVNAVFSGHEHVL